MLALMGGKGTNLVRLSRMEGVRVPEGFCISTEAFKRMFEESPSLKGLRERLALLTLEDQPQIKELCAEIRSTIEAITLPEDLQQEIGSALLSLGENLAYAVRSSATAEDLPTSSFAGQQDSYLNLLGREAILKHVSRCWASLFSERAVLYRLQNDFDHRQVQLAVVVQKMVLPQAAGILFTADPLTSNRKVLSIDAAFGLGEALVSGLVSADTYKVREAEIVEKMIARKEMALYGLPAGGSVRQQLEPELQKRQVLTDSQILELARLGRHIEGVFAYPQDIEWCLANDGFYVVQSRPVTTLFPIPQAQNQENHVYVSVGHQQMMTDAMKPLGLSFFLLTSNAPMHQAGGRLFVDCTQQLASPFRRNILLNIMGKSDPLTQDALRTIIERGFIKTLPDAQAAPVSNLEKLAQTESLTDSEDDLALVADLIRRSQSSIDSLKQAIQSKSGLDLIDFILEDIQEMKRILHNPQSLAVIMAAMNAATWLNENLYAWLGKKNVADTLTLSVANNITSEMGLALMELADLIRPFPAVIAYLQAPDEEAFLDGLLGLEGGQIARDALGEYLDKYGMRCAGEIDLTRPRWREKPTILVPMILSHIQNFEPGASQRKFEQGRQQALNKEQQVLADLRQLPEGEHKAAETQAKISLLRNLSGYREYPKYSIISRYFIYKQALLKEAEQLVQARLIDNKQDIYYLSFEELREVLRSQKLDPQLISQRQAEYSVFKKLRPPRVMTSEGEIISGKYARDTSPQGALSGIAVSSGIVEGRARVVFKMEEACLEEGDILVTPFTDPGWTPLFLSIKGLVTEVGSMMTHGAVIAREYGLPAVVSVENATRLIKDGQRIRLNGTEGYLEIL